MFYLLAVLAMVAVAGALLVANEHITARQLQSAVGPGDAVARSTGRLWPSEGHSTGWREYRSETAIVPVQWGELLPAHPETVRIPAQPATPEAGCSETRTPQRTPTLEADVTVPILQAVLTALALAVCAGLLSWAMSWSWRVPVIVAAVAVALGWLWRLRVVDSLLWQVETFTGRDLNGDGVPGRPQVSYTLANPATARQTVAREARQDAQSAERQELLQFLDACYMKGTAEGRHGVMAAGPDRAAYLVKRDALMGLGIAKWKHPERPKAGWAMACSRQRARELVQTHVL